MLAEVKHLVITGGEGGLAEAVASAFDDPAWDVLAPGRAELDVTARESIAGYLEPRVVDLLVCTAGTIRDMPLARLDESAWDEVISVNFEGAAACANAVLPGMIRRGSGHVVFISSFSALHPPVGQAAYAAAKAALLGLTAALARSHGKSGIRVNVILPGFMETPMTAKVEPSRKSTVIREHALGRLNTPEAVGKFIRFLAEELPFTSGQVFQLDSRVS